jgi:hypothetical protein
MTFTLNSPAAEPHYILPLGLSHPFACEFSAVEVSHADGHKLTDGERTGLMVALTSDLHVVASCVTTSVSAVLLSVWHLAETWYVRALLGFSISH